MIPQSGFLYEGTFMENIHPDKTDEERRADHIALASLIVEKELPLKQDDFFIEGGGKNLSQGEKQIINFLRILQRDNELILLDEATSNMDQNTGSSSLSLNSPHLS